MVQAFLYAILFHLIPSSAVWAQTIILTFMIASLVDHWVGSMGTWLPLTDKRAGSDAWQSFKYGNLDLGYTRFLFTFSWLWHLYLFF